ncbi:MAG: uroporphyrinogen decarboxylase [Firmicutes bacterium]|nr:uroporphyrinogen decarboxylase [Bacillota bacterium]
MSSDLQELYRERLGRYTACIALQETDRVPISFGTTYFATKHMGYTYQQVNYDPKASVQMEVDFAKKYPQQDTQRGNVSWAPPADITASVMSRSPGRDLPPTSLNQFVEGEYMKADEYRQFIEDPIGYKLDVFYPRVLGEYTKGSVRRYMMFLKSGFMAGFTSAMNREKVQRLKNECGMPVPSQGSFTAPFDLLSDSYRGLNGIMRDMFRQPDLVKEACEAVLPEVVHRAMASADSNKHLPIFIATHKPCFMSPKQFDEFYWPTFYKGVKMLIDAGWPFRIFLEGDWTPHWHHLNEFPKGTILADVDNEADIFEAKKAFGHTQAITGGIPTDMLILGTPEDIKARVKLLCETVGKDGGWMPNGGGHIPTDTKPENFVALLEAVNEYGRYHTGPAPEPVTRKDDPNLIAPDLPEPQLVTPWEVVKEEYGWSIPGDEELIKSWWDRLDRMAYNWVITTR